MYRIIFIGILCMHSLLHTSFASIIHVPADQPTIQAGIDAAQVGDTVLVADGTYSDQGNTEINFAGKAIRVMSQNGYAACIVDCKQSSNGFLFSSYETTDSVLDGFTIRNGQNHYGAGIICDYASPHIANCLITNNSATGYGGGFCLSRSNAFIENCVISNNLAAEQGAGINCDFGANPRFSGCTISENSAAWQGGGAIINYAAVTFLNTTFTSNSASSGAGLFSMDSSVTCTGCDFNNNTVYDYGAGICYTYTLSEQGVFELSECSFVENRATGAGAISMQVLDSVFEPIIQDCRFIGNSSVDIGTELLTGGGGAISFNKGGGRVVRCTFEKNRAALGGAINIEDVSANPVIGNALADANSFADNYALSGADLFYKGWQKPNPQKIEARFNKFQGYPYSDYYVSPVDSFILTGSTFETTPITQDVFVSPSGSDSNSGLSWDQAFLSITHAYRSVCATNGMIVIHLAPGTYSPGTTGELYPIPIRDGVSLLGAGTDTTILDGSGASEVLYGYDDSNLGIANLTVTGATGNAAIRCIFSDCVFHQCKFVGNEGTGLEIWGGIQHLSSCIFGKNNNSGIQITQIAQSEQVLSNCIFTQNYSKLWGAALGMSGFSSTARTTIENCTITANSGENISVINLGYGKVNIRNSIIWNNVGPSTIRDFYGTLTIEYSDIQGGWDGTGNINADPLFITGPDGNFYLSHIDSGQTLQSPCVDAGMNDSASWYTYLDEKQFPLNLLTTNPDEKPDAGRTDMGVHYAPAEPLPSLGVCLYMPTRVLPFERFGVDGYLVNNELSDVTVNVFFVLQFYDAYYFWPQWSYYYPPYQTQIDYITGTLPFGTTHFEIVPSLTWPDTGDDYVSSLAFYGAILSADMSSVLGDMAVIPWSFGKP